jgi:streptogramin lyase
VGIAIDVDGNVFVADSSNDTVEELNAADGYSTAVAVAGGFNNPARVAMAADGNVHVADYGNHAIKEVILDGVFHDGFE